MGKVITIIDYGAGNLHSVSSAVAKLGYEPKVTNQADDIMKAKAVILPGVGAAADTMANLKKLNMVVPIREYVAAGRPFLGVCIGMQVLFTSTEEGGRHKCLDIISGQVRKLPPGLKIPHMGWNQVKQRVTHPIFDGIADKSNFYFVHSFYPDPDDKSLVAGETEYGIAFSSIIAKGNLVATQFHPEKSGEVGLKIYDNFIKLALTAGVNTK